MGRMPMSLASRQTSSTRAKVPGEGYGFLARNSPEPLGGGNPLRMTSKAPRLPSPSTLAVGDLAGDGFVFDLRVVGEEEGFGEDDGEGLVAFEGEEDVGGGIGGGAVGDDAEVLVVGFHEDVAG